MTMKAIDPLVHLQLPQVRQILSDEVWLEGERRRQAVPDDDPVVIDRVCEILLREGERLRASALDRLGEQRDAA
jgi:hypothetical protein